MRRYPAVAVSIRFFGVVPGVGQTWRDNIMNILKTLARNLESSLRTIYPGSVPGTSFTDQFGGIANTFASKGLGPGSTRPSFSSK